MAVAQRIGEARRLDAEMEPLRRGRIHALHVELLEDVEDDQGGDALAVRRQLGDADALVVTDHRRLDRAAVACEVLELEEAALGLRGADDVLGDAALVEALGALGGDLLQRRAQRRAGHALAGGRGAAVDEVVPCGAGILGEGSDIARPVEGDARRHRPAFLGVADGVLQHAAEVEPAVGLEDRLPGLDGAGHGDGMDGIGRHGGEAGGPQLLGGHGLGGAARAVIAPDRLAGLGDEGEAVAADAGHVRLDHGHDADRGDGGIRRGPPPAFRMSMAAAVASGWEVAAMASVA